SKGGCIHAGECAWNRGKIMEPALVEEAVKLRLVKCLELNGNIVTQLVQRLQAAVRDELRRIKTAAEQSPAIAAQLGHQERGNGVVCIGGEQAGEAGQRGQGRQP